MGLFIFKDENKFRVFLFLLTIFIFATIYYFVATEEDFEYSHKDNEQLTFMEALHYSTIIQSTIGLGQISPKSTKMMNITTIQALTTPLIVLT